MLSPLTPPSVEALAQSRSVLPFAFTGRFFYALLLGLLWLIPAWRFPQLLICMAIWDAAVVVFWLIDLLRLPSPDRFSVSRIWSSPPTLAHSADIQVKVESTATCSLKAFLIDEAAPSLRKELPILSAMVAPNTSTMLTYSLLPTARGDVSLGSVYLRYRSATALAERWAVIPLAQTICVLPGLIESEEQALHLVHSRMIEARARQRHQPGVGRVFESLREYREGDELRDISWSATARRHQLVSRNYSAEMSQAVWIVVDAGRLMRALVLDPGTGLPLSKLDHAVNAALALSQIASQHGDRVGLLAYGRSIQQILAPASGPLQIRRFIDALARVKEERVEADHALAARTLLGKQSRRALIVWLTDFAETPATPEVINHAMHLGRRHLVLFGALSQPDLALLAQTNPQSESAMFRHAAALEIVDRRELLLRNLRQAGVLALELDPGKVRSAVVNQYLKVKDRSLV